MPTQKSSEKANTTDKIFSKEQVKKLSIPELMKMEDEGWRHAEPAPSWGGYTYKSPDFDPAKHLISTSEGDTYIAGTVEKLPNPERCREVPFLKEGEQ